MIRPYLQPWLPLLDIPLAWIPHRRFEAGAKDYDLPVVAQVPVLFATLGFLETKRLKGWKETGTVSFIVILLICQGRICMGRMNVDLFYWIR